MSGPFPYFDVPKTGQTLGFTKAKVNSNFDTIFKAFKINHYQFDVANAGKHNYIQIPVGSFPVGLSVGDANIYSKTISGTSQLFVSPDASGLEFQLTTAVSGNNPQFGTNNIAGASGGWTFLPGGLLMNYGTITMGANPTVVTYPHAFSSPAYSVVLTAQGSGSGELPVKYTASNSIDFSIVRLASGAFLVSYIAIGPA